MRVDRYRSLTNEALSTLLAGTPVRHEGVLLRPPTGATAAALRTELRRRTRAGQGAAPTGPGRRIAEQIEIRRRRAARTA